MKNNNVMVVITLTNTRSPQLGGHSVIAFSLRSTCAIFRKKIEIYRWKKTSMIFGEISVDKHDICLIQITSVATSNTDRLQSNCGILTRVYVCAH